MIAYLDISVLLRLVLREPGALAGLRPLESLVSSELLAVESSRTIDRLRLQGFITLDAAAAARRVIVAWLEAVDLVLLRQPILRRAEEPFPTALGTLDALHLSTALVWRDRMQQDLVMGYPRRGMARAARALDVEVRGARD